MAVGAAVLLVLSLMAPAAGQPAQPSGPITLSADHIQYDTQTGQMAADGHVRASRADIVITADHLTGNLKTGDVLATGHVTLTQAGRKAIGSSLAYNYRTRVGRMDQATSVYRPWTVKSQTFETAGGQGVATRADITPCNPDHPAFLVRARKVVVVPDDHLTAYDASLVIYGVTVVTIPEYTESLNPNRKARSGPSGGYNNQDGWWIEYSQYFPIGDWDNQTRFRYGTLSGVSGEDIVSRRFGDHVWSAHVGRAEAFDQNGNLSELDQYSIDLSYNRARLLDWPASYLLEGHVGRYAEHTAGAVTNAIATREEGWINFISDIMPLGPNLTWAWSAQARGDLYDTGQNRIVLGYSIGLTDLLDPSNSVTLSYNFAAVTGSSPFSFDTIGNDSTVGLSYGYGSGGFLQTAGVSLQYSFLSQQTSLQLNVALAVTRDIIVSASTTYNFTTQTVGETDYAINVICDCLSVGVQYRTFPATPSQNAFYLTIGLTPFPETFVTRKF